jgi:hypothetical protein
VLLSFGSKAAPDNQDLMATSIEQSPEVREEPLIY